MIENISMFDNQLENTFPAFEALVEHLRSNYEMDELWNGIDEFKFRKSGKTLVTLYLRHGYFIVLIIFGKEQRLLFESRRNEFSRQIQTIYDEAKTYHDGKWMFIDIHNDLMIPELIEWIHMKKKPIKQL